MCRPWGIRLKRERNEVCINPKGISPWVTLSAGRMRGVACRFGFTHDHPSAISRNARRRPRRPVRCPRQPRQRSTSAAPSCARHRGRQLKKKILNTFPTISGCFVLGCQCFVARIYCDGQYFYWAARLVFGNKRGN